MTPRAGLFVTLEGGEGAGKSTAAAALAGMLRDEGREVVLTREPGGTPAAEAIRALLLGELPLDPLAQTMLHFAARADHVAALIRPALRRGAIVVCDRYADSTMAYQGFGLGVDVAAVASMTRLVDLRPALTFILEVSDTVAKQRREARGGADDRYERMGEETRARIANGFRAIAAADPSRCVIVDAGQAAAAVAAELRARLKERCGI